MTGIFVGIPTVHDYKPFRESLSIFLDSIKTKYDIEVLEVKYHMRDDARNILVDEFLKSGKDYLLFLDDDHEGHKPEMLESLMNANALFCSMKCYARYYPFQITTVSHDIKFHDNHNLYIKNNNKGYATCKFMGFGMALIRKELFSLIDKPYFKCDMIGEKEDNYFCEKLIAKGIEPVGCFDYALSHQGINDDTILGKRQRGIIDFVKNVNQRLMIQRIKNAVKNKEVEINEYSKGRLELADLVLNNDIRIVDTEENTKEVLVLNK